MCDALCYSELKHAVIMNKEHFVWELDLLSRGGRSTQSTGTHSVPALGRSAATYLQKHYT